MLVFILGLSALYRWAPSRRSNGRRSLTVGAFVASILWFVGSMGFAAYVANFGNYNETFGSLGGVIVLLTWLWLSALIVLFGGLVDAEIETQLAFMKKSGAETPSVPLPHEEAEEVIPLAQAGDQSRPVP